MRRNATRLFALIPLTLAFASSVLGAGAQPEASLDSGALGLTRDEIEVEWGRANTPIDVPGHPIYDETYAYPDENGTLFVTYRNLNGDDIAVYVEFAWSGDGATEQVAHAVGKRLLPADSEITELYVAPRRPMAPSPSSPSGTRAKPSAPTPRCRRTSSWSTSSGGAIPPRPTARASRRSAS